MTTAPILVLGLGNMLLQDDGLGLKILEAMRPLAPRWGGSVDLLDGGTQGIALLGHIEGRRALVILDAVSLGASPGTLHQLEGQSLLKHLPGAARTTHEGNAGDLLRAAALTGSLPPRVLVLGIEPETVRTGVGLSAVVTSRIASAAERAALLVDALVCEGAGGALTLGPGMC